jgi:prepilin-type N-terminal cleavage/methylation domain-containing protein
MNTDHLNTGHDDAGFSLVEVLIGLALMALIAALAAGALGGLARTGQLQERRDTAASVEPVEAYLRRLLADVRPVRVGAAATPLLAAEPDRLSVVSGYVPKGAIAGLQRVSLRLVEGNEAGRFDLEEVRTLHRDGAGRDGEVRTRLLTNLTGLSFRYLAAGTATGQTAVWLERWTSATALPRLIRVDITFPQGDGRQWPPLDIATLGATGP